MDKKLFYSWNSFDKDCQQLARQYRKYGRMIKNIYGVPRGGLVVAVKLSHLLDRPVIMQQKFISKDTLVVDDICDTGETLKKLLTGKKFFGIATLWLKESPGYPVNFVNRKKDQWIIFPFETNKTSKYDGTI